MYYLLFFFAVMLFLTVFASLDKSLERGRIAVRSESPGKRDIG